MAPRRSPRGTVHSQPSNTDASSSHPKRGSHGFQKFKNGLLDLTSISDDETALCDKNAQDFELLQLPAEIRAMIWKYALSDQTLHLAPYRDASSTYAKAPILRERFPLLRVCRQIYSEAALFPHTESTFFFSDPEEYLKHVKYRPAKRARHIKMGTQYWKLKNYFTRAQLEAIRTIEIIMWPSRWRKRDRFPAHIACCRERFEPDFQDKDFPLKFVSRNQWRAIWSGDVPSQS
ncbi:hypothetical protein EK21DRAFT_107465 [Setomelanomma holmii]|uniref:2EXR domain-containing protein n=1 Tax=Setomelanomma holmii TaxID=210430 RepID=A0A9P4HJS8_9PLEO|nr:hypothetical protein EK21DRAFT_107465 [Setomelanomma holmii]